MSDPFPGRNPAGVLAWHQQLLFRLAFPDNLQSYAGSSAALTTFAEKPRSYPSSVKYAGMRGSSVTGVFSYTMARWLANRFPGDCHIESASADAESARLLFRFLLPACEYEEISAGEADLPERIRLLYHPDNGSSLGWLLDQMDGKIADQQLRELLFHQLNLYIRWEIRDPYFNLSMMRLPVTDPCMSSQFPGNVTPLELTSKKLPAPVALNISQKKRLMDLAKASLLFLYRETEPFTYASPDNLTFFELENGLSVALYGMEADRILSVESYMGYLAFRNGVPIAYGGGWLFGQRCQFGIHIFPAFRGGGSGYLLAQLIRVYHQYFRARRFVIKPYQFGKQNPDAIRSGAFWFYYKAGFRPEDQTLADLAGQEAQKKNKQKDYRSSPALLRKLTGSSLFLELAPGAFPDYDAAVLSKHITSSIIKQFNGNRQLALHYCSRSLATQLGMTGIPGAVSPRTWENWSLLLALTLPRGKLNHRFRKQILRLLELKSQAREKPFILHLQVLAPLWTYWNEIARKRVQTRRTLQADH